MKQKHFHASGVTLLELLVVVVVVGILASVAVPSYRAYLLRAQRSDATTALLRIASAQEKHVMQYGVYVTSTANMPNTHALGGLGLPATTEHGYYSVVLAATATGYTATATPVAGGAQVADTTCASFVVDESGGKRAFNSAAVDKTSTCYR